MNRAAAINQHLANTHVYVRDRDEHDAPVIRELTDGTCKSSMEKLHLERVMDQVGEQLAALPDNVLTATAQGTMFDGNADKKPMRIMVFEGDEKGLSAQEKALVYNSDYIKDPVKSHAEETIPGIATNVRRAMDFSGLEYQKGAQWISNDIYDVTKRLTPELQEVRGVIVINNKQQNISQRSAAIEYKPVMGQMCAAYLDSIPTLQRAQLERKFVSALMSEMRQGMSAVTYLASLANRDVTLNVGMVMDDSRSSSLRVKVDLKHLLPVAIQDLCGGVTMGRRDAFNWKHCPEMLGCMLQEFPDMLPRVEELAPQFAKEWKAGLVQPKSSRPASGNSTGWADGIAGSSATNKPPSR